MKNSNLFQEIYDKFMKDEMKHNLIGDDEVGEQEELLQEHSDNDEDE